jgi:putative transposase
LLLLFTDVLHLSPPSLSEDGVLIGLIDAQFSRTTAEHAFEITAYCYMPEHVHVVLAGLHDGASLLPCVEVMRQRSSRVAKASRGIHLWQDGYFERVLRDDEQLEAVARYVFENPLRGGLTDHASKWLGSGGRYWASYAGLPELKLGPTYDRELPELKLGPTYDRELPELKLGPTYDRELPELKLGPTYGHECDLGPTKE